MEAPAAILWQFRRQHRWGFLACLAYFVFLAVFRTLYLQSGRTPFSTAESFAFVVMVPFDATFLYLLAVFSFGLSGDLMARQSMYPTRFFTLPVSNRTLTAWPMLYGICAMAILWFATRFLGLWPVTDMPIPRWWPALLAAALLAWTQALMWLPYPFRGMRIIIAILTLVTLDAIVMVALQFQASERTMIAMLAPLPPLAYAVARVAVRRARSGETPDWGTPLAGYLTEHSTASRDFASPERAQLWFEWRRHGKSLPLLVAIVVPFELALLFLFPDTPSIIFGTLLGTLLTPPFLASFVAATVRQSDPSGRGAHEMPAFLAVKPVTSPSLIGAKFRAAFRSTLVTWTIVTVAMTFAVMTSGTTDILAARIRPFMALLGIPRATVVVLLASVALLASTWKQLVQSIYVGVSGREWLVKASLFATLGLLAIALPFAAWALRNGAVMTVLWNGFIFMLAFFVVLKVCAAAWLIIRLRRRGLVSAEKLLAAAVCWDVLVFAIYGLVAWIFPELLVRNYLLALLAIAEVPFVRLAAAPLAFDWSRHR